MKKNTMASLGEFGFIEMIKKSFSANSADGNITAGIGDDCFCFKSAKGIICVTKDMLVEDSHFRLDWISPYELGEKAVEVNISDIAAMGAVKPKYVFIGLACPANTPADFVKKLYRGIKKACGRCGAFIAGGDTVRSGKLAISVTVIGEGCGKIIKRSGARNGDLIGVTNCFGDSAAGLELLTKYGAGHKYNKEQKYLIRKHNLPRARLREACEIAGCATAMTDASDGLYISVGLLAGGEKKGADIHIDRIPLSRQLKKIEKNPLKRTNLALYGGEDFELVFTVHASKARTLKAIVPSVSYIGIINNCGKVRYFNNGKEEKSVYSGFRHF